MLHATLLFMYRLDKTESDVFIYLMPFILPKYPPFLNID